MRAGLFAIAALTACGHSEIQPDPPAAAPPSPAPADKQHTDLVVLERAQKPLSSFTGTIELTAFDGAHLVGTVALDAQQQGGGAVKLAGTFEAQR